MAQQFELISWSFTFNDWGTHGQEDGYQGKLNQLIGGYNTAIAAVNAQLQAGDDSAAIKGQIEQIRDVDIVSLLNQANGFVGQAKSYRDQAQTIALQDISGTDLTLNSLSINGVDMTQALNSKVDKTLTINGVPLSSSFSLTKYSIGLPLVDNTSDLDKPISNAQAAENRKLRILMLAGVAM